MGRGARHRITKGGKDPQDHPFQPSTNKLISFSMFCPALQSRGLAAACLGPGAVHALGISADPQAAPLKAAPFICLSSFKSCHRGMLTKSAHHLRAGFPSVLGYGGSIQCKRPGTEIAPQILQVCFPILIQWFLTPWPCPDYRVYAAGGMGADLRPHNYLQHYDMLKDIWVSLAAMPTARYAATSFLRGTKIYVLGKHPPSSPQALRWLPRTGLGRCSPSLSCTHMYRACCCRAGLGVGFAFTPPQQLQEPVCP